MRQHFQRNRGNDKRPLPRPWDGPSKLGHINKNRVIGNQRSHQAEALLNNPSQFMIHRIILVKL